MQINHHYHSGHFRSLGDMLDPKQNVDYAARFLLTLKHRHDTWSMAVARYHAGPDNNPAQKQYVCRVIANMVATGFGQWTAQRPHVLQPVVAERCRRDMLRSTATHPSSRPPLPRN